MSDELVTAKPLALIFDVFGTLVDWRGSVARDVAKVLGNGVDADAFARAWRAQYQPSMEKIRDGSRGFVNLDDLHLENLSVVLKTFGIGDLGAEDMEWLNCAWHRLDPWPEVPQALDEIRRHALIAPCSNGNTGLMVRLARHAGFPWDTVLGAQPAQGYKPQPQVYLTAVQWLDLEPSRVMMVAAHNEDLSAARDCGLQTGFFPRPDEHGAWEARDLAAESNWTIVADDLFDLAVKLGFAQSP